MRALSIILLMWLNSQSLFAIESSKTIAQIDSLLSTARIISSQNIPEAEKLLIEAHTISLELNYLSGEAEALRLLGLLKFFVVDYPAALELFIKSRDLFEKAENTKGKARAINNIAVLYNYQEMHQKALDLYEEIILIYESINDNIGISGIYNNMAGVFRSMDDPEKALEYFRKSLSLHSSEPKRHKAEISRIYNNLGHVFLDLNMPDSSYYYFNRSLEMRLEINEVQGVKNSYQGLGQYYEYIEDYQAAMEYYEKSLKIAKDIAITYEIESSAQMLYPIYFKLGKYKKAFETLLLFVEMKETSKTAETIKLITSLELEARFEKEQELQRLYQEEKEFKQRQLIEKQVRIRNTLIISILVLLIIAYIIYRGYRTKQKHVKILNKQKEEILEKNEELNMNQQEIMAQRSEIEKQKNLLEIVNIELQASNKKTIDSIQYAQTIQKTILPYDSDLESFCKDYFVLYKPCEIVSGDFYWYKKLNGIDIFAVGDCTGHGVPGALMTMITNGIMKSVLLEDNCPDPACALLNIHNEIIQALKQNDDHFHNHDGMDLALLFINQEKLEFTYSGASIPVYLSNNGEIKKIDADKGSIGGLKRKSEVKFNNHRFSIKENNKIWICTDGYFDQMSIEGKKFGRKAFEDILKQNVSLPMSQQKNVFESTWLKHKSNENQIDDMTLIGFEFRP